MGGAPSGTREAVSAIPGQGTYLSWGLVPSPGAREATDRCFLSPLLSESNEKMSSAEYFKKGELNDSRPRPSACGVLTRGTWLRIVRTRTALLPGTSPGPPVPTGRPAPRREVVGGGGSRNWMGLHGRFWNVGPASEVCGCGHSPVPCSGAGPWSPLGAATVATFRTAVAPGPMCADLLRGGCLLVSCGRRGRRCLLCAPAPDPWPVLSGVPHSLGPARRTP